MKYETRILTSDEAIGFVQNMRWFANMGRISWEPISKTHVRVRATPYAWSNWVSTPKESDQELGSYFSE